MEHGKKRLIGVGPRKFNSLVRFLSKSYKISFSRYGVFECYSPPLFYQDAVLVAFIYRAKGDGRDAVVIDY